MASYIYVEAANRRLPRYQKLQKFTLCALKNGKECRFSLHDQEAGTFDVSREEMISQKRFYNRYLHMPINFVALTSRFNLI